MEPVVHVHDHADESQREDALGRRPIDVVRVRLREPVAKQQVTLQMRYIDKIHLRKYCTKIGSNKDIL